MRRHRRGLLLLAAVAGQAFSASAPPSATEVVDAMRQALRSDGFELRLSATTTAASGERSPPLKLAVVGQSDDETARVAVRVIAPEAMRDRRAMAERLADGRVRTVPDVATQADDRLFGTAIAIEDLLAPWWKWHRQEVLGPDSVGGRACVRLRSSAPESRATLREVVSCVDVAGGLALQTELYGADHRLLRRIAVTRRIRRESGLDGAKAFYVTAADGLRTEVEVYAGDEHHAIAPDTFAVDVDPQHNGR